MIDDKVSKIKPPIWQCAATVSDRYGGGRCKANGSVKVPGQVAWVCPQHHRSGFVIYKGAESLSTAQQARAERVLGDDDAAVLARDALKKALEDAQDAKQWRLAAGGRRDQIRAALEAATVDWEKKLEHEHAMEVAAEKAQSVYDEARAAAKVK